MDVLKFEKGSAEREVREVPTTLIFKNWSAIQVRKGMRD